MHAPSPMFTRAPWLVYFWHAYSVQGIPHDGAPFPASTSRRGHLERALEIQDGMAVYSENGQQLGTVERLHGGGFDDVRFVSLR